MFLLMGHEKNVIYSKLVNNLFNVEDPLELSAENLVKIMDSGAESPNSTKSFSGFQYKLYRKNFDSVWIQNPKCHCVDSTYNNDKAVLLSINTQTTRFPFCFYFVPSSRPSRN